MSTLGDESQVGLLLFDEPRFVYGYCTMSRIDQTLFRSASLDPEAEHGRYYLPTFLF